MLVLRGLVQEVRQNLRRATRVLSVSTRTRGEYSGRVRELYYRARPFVGQGARWSDGSNQHYHRNDQKTRHEPKRSRFFQPNHHRIGLYRHAANCGQIPEAPYIWLIRGYPVKAIFALNLM